MLISRRFFLPIWLFFHLSLAAIFAGSLLCKRHFFINTNLFDVLPESSSGGFRGVMQADKALAKKTGSQFFILAQANTFEDAKNGAEALQKKLNEADPQSKIIKNTYLTANTNTLEQTVDFCFKYRDSLIDRDTRAKLSTEQGRMELEQVAIENAYSGFSLVPLEYAEEDPYGLTEVAIENFLKNISNSGTKLRLKDGVLCAEDGGKFYVLLRGLLTEMGASIANKKSGVKLIYSCANQVAIETGQLRFIYSGIPFHSYKSSSSAQRQVAIISALSLIAILFLLLYVFRSALPIASSFVAIGISIATAIIATLLAFGQIHVLTFVFGTTLIGTCLDYSVHFFVRWKFAIEKDPIAIRSSLFKGLFLSFASTEICYFALLFAPFAILRQIATFSIAGIASTFLTVIFVYPLFPVAIKKENLRLKPAKKGVFYHKTFMAGQRCKQRWVAIKLRLKTTGQRWVAILLVAIGLISIAIFNRNHLRLDNDIRKFYTIDKGLLQDERVFATLLNRNSGGWYFIARGSSAKELLQNEEEFCDRLQSQISEGNLTSFTAVSQFIPSALSQLLDAPEFLSQPKNQSQLELPEFLSQAVSALWIGKIDGYYYSAIMPNGVTNSDLFKEICDKDPNVFFVNKIEDIGTQLNRLTKIMLILLMASFAILVALLHFFYKPKTVLKIASAPLLVLLAEAACIATFKIPLGFFAVTAIILVFGLGLDYMIYSVEGAENSAPLTRLSVGISFLTTALSFGAIAFSSFMPVHVFGTVVFIGLTTAWGTARFISSRL